MPCQTAWYLIGGSTILAEGYWHGEEYIPEIVDDPWTNLEREAQVLGRKQIDVHAYVDPRRAAQKLAEGVRHAYEQGNLSVTLIGRLHDLIDTASIGRLGAGSRRQGGIRTPHRHLPP